MHGSERTFRQGHCCGSAEKSDINHGKSGRNPQITELETDMDGRASSFITTLF
jgi:hypothetical protein